MRFYLCMCEPLNSTSFLMNIHAVCVCVSRLLDENKKHQDLILGICSEKDAMRGELKKRSETERLHVATISKVSGVVVVNGLRSYIYSIASHSPIHTLTAVSTMQGNNQHVSLVACSGTPRNLARRSSGIEPATFLLPYPLLPPELLSPWTWTCECSRSC